MMTTLPSPSPELAARILAPLPKDSHIPGIIMSAKASHRSTQLQSFKDVCWFLRTEKWDEMLQGGGKRDIHYIDLKFLRNWISITYGDTELVEAIDGELAKAEAFGQQVGPVKDLLQQRLDQSAELIDTTTA